MNRPHTLPATITARGYDLDKDGLVARDWLDYLVRGAALIELLAGDYLTAAGGTVQSAGVARPGDAVLDRVLQEIEEADGRTWKQLLHRSRPTLDAVQEQLAHAGLIAVRENGSIAALDRQGIAAHQAHTRHLLEDDSDIAQVPILDAALLALAAVVPLETVLTREDRRRYKQRLAALTERAGATAPAVRQALAQMHRTRGLAFSAGGPVH